MFMAAIRSFLVWHRMEAMAFEHDGTGTIRARAMRGAMRDGLRLAWQGRAPKHVLCRVVKHQQRRKSWSD